VFHKTVAMASQKGFDGFVWKNTKTYKFSSETTGFNLKTKHEVVLLSQLSDISYYKKTGPKLSSRYYR
jgi:hypothetical protein